MNDPSCVFCKIVRGEIPASVVREGDHWLAILDAHPKTEGHTLIISKKHFDSLFDIPSELAEELFVLMKDIARKLLDEKYGEGFQIHMNNFPAAGQIVMHAHIHVLPRKKGDPTRVFPVWCGTQNGSGEI